MRVQARNFVMCLGLFVGVAAVRPQNDFFAFVPRSLELEMRFESLPGCDHCCGSCGVGESCQVFHVQSHTLLKPGAKNLTNILQIQVWAYYIYVCFGAALFRGRSKPELAHMASQVGVGDFAFAIKILSTRGANTRSDCRRYVLAGSGRDHAAGFQEGPRISADACFTDGALPMRVSRGTPAHVGNCWLNLTKRLLQVWCTAIPVYSCMPAGIEWAAEQGWTRSYSRVADVGLCWHLFYFAAFMASVEAGVYAMHRSLHDVRLYRSGHLDAGDCRVF